MMPRVSVIIPTYNRTAELRQAVESIRAQGLADWELLVVDDGTMAISREALAVFDDPRIQLIANERSKGPAGARNTGMLRARGEFVALLDSDDVFRPGHLEQSVGALDRNPGHDVVFGRAVYYQNGAEIPYMGPNLVRKVADIAGQRADEADPECVVFDESLLGHLIAKGCFFNISSVVFRRRPVDEGVLFDETFANAADYEYWMRLAARHKYLYLKSHQIDYYLGDDSMSNNNSTEKADRNFEESARLTRHAMRYDFVTEDHVRTLRSVLARDYYDYGYENFVAGRLGRAVALYGQSFAIRPSARALAGLLKVPASLVGIRRAPARKMA